MLRAARWAARLPGGKRPTPGLRPGERLAAALTEAGPTFIKLGQSLATRTDLLGDEVAADLARLQDRLPPFPGQAGARHRRAELGRPIEELFAEFDDTPVAAASIAQVHFAVTTDGREVAVKVLRPDIEARFARDLDMLAFAAGLLERARPALRRLKPREVVATFAQRGRGRDGPAHGGGRGLGARRQLRRRPTFRVPEVDWLRTGRRVLTLERVDGIPIDERDAHRGRRHRSRTRCWRKPARAFFNQVFRDGFFHADLHPGNLFVTPDGNIIAVDFGIMGRLDLATRRYLAIMLRGFLERDYGAVADVHFQAGYVPADQPRDTVHAGLPRHRRADPGPAAQRDLDRPAAGAAVPRHRDLPYGDAAAAPAAAEDHDGGGRRRTPAQPRRQHVGAVAAR